MIKKIDDALVKATAAGTIDRKALAIKLALMAGATAAGIAGTILVQRAIDQKTEDPE